MPNQLPQEFPRDLALLSLDDVLPELKEGAREAYARVFEACRMNPQGVLLAGKGGLRPLMALMRVVVLRLSDLNLERFPDQGSQGRLLSAYVMGPNLRAPLPDRAAALFVERADQAPPETAVALAEALIPIFATWEGPASGPVWEALRPRCELILVS